MRKIQICLKPFSSLLFVALLTISQVSNAEDPFSSNEDSFLPVEQAYTVAPELSGSKVQFMWTAADGYYLYRHQFSLRAISAETNAEIALAIPDGLKKYDEIFQEELEVYYGTVVMSAEVLGWEEPYELQLSSQGCADAGLCYPPRTQYFSVIDGVITETPVSTIIPNKKNSSANNLSNETELNSEGQSLLFVILGAIIGGMILNLMPCVFPVLSLKALHLASGSASQHRINGWYYTSGVCLSFIGVGVTIALAKSAGSSLGWGFQLQQPIFVAALIYLFFVLSLNLFGLFEIGTSWMGVGNKLTQGDGALASFFTGVLAAVVASPCSAPFMATAIGYTLTQGPLITLMVFLSLGAGMALPYLLLSHSPQIAAKLPAPGPWMNTFKQFLAFPLLFTCVWLLIVLGNQTNAYSAAMIVGGTICIAMAFWMLNHQAQSSLKWISRAIAALLFVGAGNLALHAKTDSQPETALSWEAYSPENLKRLRSANKAIFVDLTADWCITCKINERVAIKVDKVIQFAKAHDVVMMQGDWTKPNPEITELLNRFDRNGVPLYLMYGSGSESPEVLPQILTPNLVIEAMERAL